jgi:hypothetical protein
MAGPVEPTDTREEAIICPEEARGWKVWIDLSGIVPKLRVEAEVLVANPNISFQLTEGERVDGDDGVTQYLEFSYREGGSPAPIGSWQKVEGPDITAPSAQDGRYYKSVIIECDGSAYHQEDDPQPLPAGEDGEG